MTEHIYIYTYIYIYIYIRAVFERLGQIITRAVFRVVLRIIRIYKCGFPKCYETVMKLFIFQKTCIEVWRESVKW